MRRFKQVDVFTDKPFLGNPVAVVIDAEGLDAAAMQRIACWTNLSETTFLLKSGRADYQVRIFTPRRELPFAGHPTLGSAHAALESGFVPKKARLTQECAAGIFQLSVEEGKIFVLGPKPAIAEIDAARIGRALGVPAKGLLRIDVGAVWLIGEIADAAQLAAMKPELALIAEESIKYGMAGVTVFAPSGEGKSAIHVRSFAPAHGIAEDPVCGTGNLAIAAYLAHTGQSGRYGERYLARQGMQVGRDGQVFLRLDPDGIRIGGPSVTCIDGSLTLK